MAVHAAREPVRERDQLSEIVRLISIGFLVIGIAGFIPGITTHYGDLAFAGRDSGAKLFGVFEVSILLNLVHLAFGVAGLLLSRTPHGARLFLVGGGLIYLVLALYGFLAPEDSSGNFVPLDHDDNLLHLGLGLGMLTLGVAPETTPGRPIDTLAGFLASAAIFASLVGIAYRPLRLIPLAIALALIAAAIGGRHSRLAFFAVYTGAVCFVLGMAAAVASSHPLW